MASSFINYFWHAPPKLKDDAQPDTAPKPAHPLNRLNPSLEPGTDPWARVNDGEGRMILRPLLFDFDGL